MNELRRVVVTGVGMVTPLAPDAKGTWDYLLNGYSSAATITKFDSSNLITNYACEVKQSSSDIAGSSTDNPIKTHELRKLDDFIIYAIAATDEALNDSEWKPDTDEARYRTGVMIGSGIGGLGRIEDAVKTIVTKGANKVSPFFVPSALINSCSAQVSIRYGFKGPNHAVATACASGAHAIGDAARMIMLNDADIMIAGGSESPITELGISGFNACKALSTNFRSNPEAASRPFDSRRDGFVMGEGAGVVILEEYDHARKRGAKIYAELTGYGLSGDAFHITRPSAHGEGGYRSMQNALMRAQLNSDDIDYINAHATGTHADNIELEAIVRLVQESASSVTISSSKASTGHLLGAAGAIEFIFAVLALRDQIAPPTINLDSPDNIYNLDLAANTPKERNIRAAMTNSFAFGGTNASLIVESPKP